MSKRSKRSGHSKRSPLLVRLKRFLEWRKQQKAKRQAKAKRALAKKRSAKSRKTSAIKKWLTSPSLWFRGLFRLPGLAWRSLRKSWKRRSPILLLQSIPAIASIIVGAYFFSASTLTTRGDLVDSYTLAARSAMSEERFEQAKVYLDRLVKLGVEDNGTLYMMARAFDAVGDQDRVAAVLNKIAPNDRPVHGDAHFWKAERIARAADNRPEMLAEIELHLLYTLRLDPRHADAHYRLAQLYEMAGRSDRAVTHLEQIVGDRPIVSIDLARVYLLSGDRDRAISMGNQARDLMERRSRNEPMDLGMRLAWAQSELFLDRYSNAVEILESGIGLHHDNENSVNTLRRALALTYIEYSDWLKSNREDSEAEQLQLLELALSTYPYERELLERFVLLLQGDTWETAKPRLMRLLSQGKSVAFVHLVLGTAAGERGNHDEAVFHLTRANELQPGMMIILNNLAWYIATSPDPDLQQALQLVELAVEQAPEFHAIRDTRGQILVKLGRFAEALPDLEFALPVHQDSVQLHEALAEAYANLAQPELEQLHRNRALELSSDQSN